MFFCISLSIWVLHSVDAFLLNGAIPVPCTPWSAYFSFPWSLLIKLLVWMPFSSFGLQMSWINKNTLFELVKLARLTWLSWKVSGSSSHRDQVESNWMVLSGRYNIRDMIWFDLIWSRGYQIWCLHTCIPSHLVHVCLNLMTNISAKLDRPEQSQNKSF